MALKNATQLQNTREKLRELEAHYESRRRQPGADSPVRRLSLQSVKKLINQLKEEIARYEAHQSVR